MDIISLKEIASKLMSERKAHLEREKGFIYYHGLRVSKLSLKLREMILPKDTSHDDIIEVASIFHDIAKGIEPHGKYGAVLARDIVKGYCTEAEATEIAEIIKYHSLRKKDNEYSEYIKIVQDADILDHFGTIEIWMNFQYYAHKDEPIHNSLEFYKKEYKTNVKDCRESLNYEISREIFDDKVKFGYSFINRFEVEAAGNLVEIGYEKKDLKISEMLDLSYRLWDKQRDIWAPMEPKHGKTFILYMIEEIGEAIAIIKKKGEECIMNDAEVREHFVEELGDVVMYFMDVLNRFNISSEEFSCTYIKKFEHNMKRDYEKQYKNIK